MVQGVNCAALKQHSLTCAAQAAGFPCAAAPVDAVYGTVHDARSTPLWHAPVKNLLFMLHTCYCLPLHSNASDWRLMHNVHVISCPSGIISGMAVSQGPPTHAAPELEACRAPASLAWRRL